ncbi:MAG: NADH-quinone oxidoreductase subunit N [Nitrospiraceae bacterium]|nr:NADH-quinone oxidoreductase subunit N [Nitrospiraceae bacterium]
MTLNFIAELRPILSEMLMTCLALVVLLLEVFVKRKETIGFIGIIGAVFAAYFLAGSGGKLFNGMFISDGYSIFFKVIFILNVIVSILMSVRYVKIENINHGEYYGLMLFSTIGMMLMASAGDLMVLYLGVELMALSVYVLTGFIKHDIKSNEASIKYFLLGVFASAFLLYGIAMIYGTAGTTDINGIANYIEKNNIAGNPVLILAMIFFVIAFSFKIAAVPFHMWAPDAYEGAPTSVTAFMSVGPKAAGFAVIGRVFFIAFSSLKVEWTAVLIPIAILTMAAGNILALSQTNIKRMLAYSSIAHAGYILLGIVSGTADGISSVLFYLLVYAFMNLGAFAVVVMLRSEGFKGDNIRDYEGLAKTHPVAAALMLVFMFSLTGIPPAAGFMAKFYIFISAVNAGYTWLVIIAVIFSVVSAYFYLRIVMLMYMRDPIEIQKISLSPALGFALMITAAAVIIIGIFPSYFINLAQAALLII